jgi:hypothetical protein
MLFSLCSSHLARLPASRHLARLRIGGFRADGQGRAPSFFRSLRSPPRAEAKPCPRSRFTTALSRSETGAEPRACEEGVYYGVSKKKCSIAICGVTDSRKSKSVCCTADDRICAISVWSATGLCGKTFGRRHQPDSWVCFLALSQASHIDRRLRFSRDEPFWVCYQYRPAQ